MPQMTDVQEKSNLFLLIYASNFSIIYFYMCKVASFVWLSALGLICGFMGP